MKKVTIATHNGSQAARDHNIRNENVVSKESHIDLTKVHEIWVDERPQDAYKRLFGQSIKEYNQKQTRNDRKIKYYYGNIKNDAKKHAVYEMIIGVYGKDEYGEEICDRETGKKIMKEFVEGWKKRNPNLELIGAYYHADEREMGHPHVHIDYIPVAHGYTKGPETQTGLVKAFEEMGFKKKGRITGQIQWQSRENNVLDEICRSYGLEVEHPKEEGRQHDGTERYIAKKELESTIDTTKELLDEQDRIRGEIRQLEAQRDKVNVQVEKALKRKNKAFSRSFKKDKDTGWVYNKTLANDIKEISKDIKTEVEQISKTDTDIQIQYELAEQERKKAERYAAETKERADEEYQLAEEYKKLQEDYILGTSQKIADEKVEQFIAKEFSETAGRNGRLEKFCDGLMMGNGKSVLDNFNEMEQERKQRIKRNWTYER